MPKRKTKRSSVKNIQDSVNEGKGPLHKFELILQKRFENNRFEYLIKWLNYSSAHNSWEPEHHIPEAFIQDFHDEQKRKGES